MPIPISTNRRELEKFRSLGIKVPILKASRAGIFETTQTTAEKVKSQLYVLLFTSFGERVMLPQFGTDLHNKLFDNLDEVLLNEIRKSLRTQISKYVPEAEIKQINFNQVENSLDVEIKFSLRGDELIDDTIFVTVR